MTEKGNKKHTINIGNTTKVNYYNKMCSCPSAAITSLLQWKTAEAGDATCKRHTSFTSSISIEPTFA